MKNKLMPLNIENAEIIFKNFSGKQTKITPKGVRTFTVVIPEDLVSKLIDDGWNVRYLDPIEEGDIPIPILDVRVRLDEESPCPADIYIVENGYRHPIYEDNVAKLDKLTFSNIDLVINPRYWKMNGKEGIKAYLGSMYASGIQDVVTSKYLNVPIADE